MIVKQQMKGKTKMDIAKAIETCEQFYENLRQCTKCKSCFDLDDGFINIAEICDGSEEEIDQYEKKHNISLEDFWCERCASITLAEIENNGE